MKKILLFIIIAGIIFGALKLFKTRSAQKAAQSTPIERHYAVKTLKAKQSTLEEHRPFLAELKPLQGINLSTKLTGIITRLHVSENSVVKKGDILVNIDDAELQSNLRALASQKKAQLADLKYTQSVLDRNEKLYKAGGLSREKYEASVVLYQNKTAQLDTSVQKIKQLRIQQNYLNIKAPFSGTVSTLLLDEGDIALPGKPILKLHSDKQKMTFSYMPTSKVIRVGQAVLLQERRIGEISKLYDHSENALLVAEVQLDAPLGRANHSLISIEVLTNEKEGCSVPLSTLLHQDDKHLVMLYENGEFHPYHVNILLQDHHQAIISPCPTAQVASASEAKLSLLPSLGKVKVSH
ncbi:MAG: efflux RND transporter periplasmic adaptor subunit [Campylobacterota bacterium]|nr:efflux RND transporter periplasmic adaptor subunit [Campylobacterota bacterium]